jgi:hypothetical protein
MSLISLTTTEMANLSGTWVAPTHADHLALIAYPALAAYMTHIEQAHQGVLDIQGSGDGARLSVIGEQQGELNVEHDDFARAIHYNLRSQALLAPTEVEAQQFLDLDTLLFPEGLSVINLSYAQTAGYAQLLGARLRPEHEAALAAIPTRFGNLLEHVRAWMAVALELGKLSHARGQSGPPRRPTLARTRVAWVRMVNTLRTLINTLSIDDPVVSEIMTRIDVATRVAGRRTSNNVPPRQPDAPILPPSEPDDEPDDFLDDDDDDDEKTLPGMSFPANDSDDDEDDGDPASTQPTRQLEVQPGRMPRVIPMSAKRHR